MSFKSRKAAMVDRLCRDTMQGLCLTGVGDGTSSDVGVKPSARNEWSSPEMI